jgi:hypothetical protein
LEELTGHQRVRRVAAKPPVWCVPVPLLEETVCLSRSDGEEGLQLKFVAPFALVISFNGGVALVRFLDLFGYFCGFVFRPEGFPVERRVERRID